MSIIIARFDGTCAECGISLNRGEQINYRDKKAYCLDCQPDVEDGPFGSVDTADRLGYKPFSSKTDGYRGPKP